MPKFAPEDVRALMDDVKVVRNVVVVGAMGQGKTCVMDCIGAQCGLVGEDKIGETRFTHVRQDEKDKGSTFKTNINSMVYGSADRHLFHMVDTPGHAEYSAELSIALPLADGALLVISGNGEGLPAQTNRHLKDLNAYKIKPVLIVGRLDVSILVMEKSSQEVYDDLSVAVDAFNTAMSSCMPGAQLCAPEDGTILFGSPSSGWLFALPQVAQIYASKFGIEVEKMAKRLWGEHYFSAKAKKWSTASTDDNIRAFNLFVLDPILKVKGVCDSNDMGKLEKMLGALGVALGSDDKKLEGKGLFKRVMQLWFPAGVAIGDTIIKHIPNPAEAQKVRFDVLSAGPTDDPSALAIKKCDPSGIALMQVVKLLPMPSSPGRFFCVGRVFSGSMNADKMQVMEDDYVPEYARVVEETPAEEGGVEADPEGESPGGKSPGSKGKPTGASATIHERRIQGVLTCTPRTYTAAQNIPCGNICALAGVDQFINKRNSICSTKDAFPLRSISFNVSPVVRVSVSPKEAKDLPKTVEALRRLAKSCPLVEINLEEGGDHIMAGCGAEHIRLLRRDLEQEYAGGITLNWGAPSVSYKETVTAESNIMCLSKSPNKHNRLFMKAEPLGEDLARAIEAKEIWPQQDMKARSKILANQFEWDKNDAMKIWGFGPAAESATAPSGANVLVDQTKACQYLGEIKESVNSGLLWAAKQGPLAEENMRAIRFNLHDVKLHTDSIHRGMGQIQPTARRCFFACTLTADCKLVEPVFMATIDAPVEASAGIMQALGSSRGELVVSEEVGDRLNVSAYVPISETIGNTPFATTLTQKTNGKAFVSYAFDHWEIMPSDPMNVTSKSYEIMMTIRKRKGLKEEKPLLADYYDKL